jgi:hypothetical protein
MLGSSKTSSGGYCRRQSEGSGRETTKSICLACYGYGQDGLAKVKVRDTGFALGHVGALEKHVLTLSNNKRMNYGFVESYLAIDPPWNVNNSKTLKTPVVSSRKNQAQTIPTVPNSPINKHNVVDDVL